jgi:Gas vesicle synthesis protein GvpL/GvpF
MQSGGPAQTRCMFGLRSVTLLQWRPPARPNVSPDFLGRLIVCFSFACKHLPSSKSRENHMAWYAYCLTEQKYFNGETRVRRPFPIDGLRGINGAQVIGYPSGEFAVIATEYFSNGALDQKATFEHARVISECFRVGTVLPFRFGTVFESETAIRESIRANRKAFMRSVAELRGKAEMHIKVVIPSAMMPARVASDLELHAVGAEYLSLLRVRAWHERETQTKARALSQQMNKLFSPIDEEVTCRRDEKGALMVGIAHLIENTSIDRYQHRFHVASRQLRDCELVLTGPWPPFHFLPQKLRLVHGDN